MKKKKLIKTGGDLIIPLFLLNCVILGHTMCLVGQLTNIVLSWCLKECIWINVVNWKLWVYLIIQTSKQCLLCQLPWQGPSKPKVLFGEAWHFFKLKQSDFYEKTLKWKKIKTFITPHNKKYTMACWTSQCHVGHSLKHYTDKFWLKLIRYHCDYIKHIHLLAEENIKDIFLFYSGFCCCDKHHK